MLKINDMERPKEADLYFDDYGDPMCEWSEYLELKEYCNYLEMEIKIFKSTSHTMNYILNE